MRPETRKKVVDWTGALVTIAAAALIASLCLAVSIWAITAAVGAQEPYDTVEQAIHDRWEARFPGEGPLAVEMARCEGWNSTARFDPAHISPTGDAGLFQINQIHGRTGGLIEGRWPAAVQTVDGNIGVALDLRGRDGLGPWANSRHCWAWILESPVGTLAHTGVEDRQAVAGLLLVSAGAVLVIMGRSRVSQ